MGDPGFVLEPALPIFLLTYALISLQRFRGFQLNRPIAALFGAALMVIFGVITWQGALQAVSGGLEILALLLGMMMMVATLEVAGFFEFLAERLVARASSPRSFFVQICVASAVLSALILNDTVVLLLTPVIIKTCKRMGAPPVPYLMAETICANIGSTATLVGNPQNAFIGISSGMSFLLYAAVMIPITGLCLAVSVAMMLRFFRKDLSGAVPEGARLPSADRLPVDRTLVGIAGAVFATVLVLFVLSSFLHISIAAIAMGGGVFMLFSTVAYKGFRVETILARVDWTILLLFVGLFVVLRGVEDAGLVQGLIAPMTSVGAGGNDPVTLSWLAGITALLSNLVSNVPAVLLLAPLVRSMNTNRAWMVLAAASTLSGNATLLGAAANLITAEVARVHGYSFPWVRFTLIGLPVAAATLLISTVAIILLPI